MKRIVTDIMKHIKIEMSDIEDTGKRVEILEDLRAEIESEIESEGWVSELMEETDDDEDVMKVFR